MHSEVHILPLSMRHNEYCLNNGCGVFRIRVHMKVKARPCVNGGVGAEINRKALITAIYICILQRRMHMQTHTHTQQSPSCNICFLLTSSSPLWTPGWYITECTRPFEHVCVAPNTGHKGVVNVGWVEGYVNIWCIDFSADSPSNLFTYTLFSLLLFDLSSPRLSFPFLSSPLLSFFRNKSHTNGNTRKCI